MTSSPVQNVAGGTYPAVQPPPQPAPTGHDAAHQFPQATAPLHTAPQPALQPSAPPSSPPDPQKVADALASLYTSKDMKVKDAVVEEFYAPTATFVDNAVQVSGHRNIKVQFHALGKMFKSVQFEPTSSTVEQQDGKQVVKIQNTQQYAMGPAVITLNVDSTLQLNSEGKIQHHSDVWKGHWSSFGFCKRIVGSTSSMVMRLVRV